jgi:hypothetical protein
LPNPITAIIGNAGQANSITLKLGASQAVASNSTVISDVDIGVEDENRWIVVTFSWKKSVTGDSTTSTFVYIDGVEMTVVDPGFYEKANVFEGTASIGTFYINWPSGNTADFTFQVDNFSSTVSHIGYGIYVVYNLDESSLVGAEDGDSTLTMNVPSGGFGIASAVSHNSDASQTISGTNMTQAYSGQGGSSAYRTVSGSQSHSCTNADVSVNVIGEYV